MLDAVALLWAALFAPMVQEIARADAAARDSAAAPPPAVCLLDEASGARSADHAACAVSALRAPDGDAPVLDGRLDDAVWADAQPATGFRQSEPTPGAPASQRTEAKIVYTATALYVGMRMYDTSPDSIRAQFVRRDDNEAVSDWASVTFDSYDDQRTAFEFATTPTGTRVDVLHRNDVDVDVEWDAVWNVVTGREEQGWVAEFEIPLSQLRFSSSADMKWGVEFSRKIARHSEVSYWAPIPPTAGKQVSLYGDLVGLKDLSPPGRLELLPYSVGRLSRVPGDPANPFYRKNDLWGTGGLDLKYGVSSDLTLTATVNPDFGQVEADPSQVNLTAFETFYPEKRPFFTEGTEIFDFRLSPEAYAFYSRRIGRFPQLGLGVPDSGFADTPQNARILGAVKLSGKTAGGWSVGAMEAVTGQVTADVSGPAGVQSQPLEPLTNYTVGRVIRDFRDGKSGLGILATGVNRRMNEPRFDQLRSAAYLGALDGWHRFGSGDNYEFSGLLLATHVRGSADAIARTQRSATHFFTRPDAAYLTYDSAQTALSGWAGEMTVQKRGGGNWTWRIAAGARSPGVDFNDLGYMLYANVWYGSLTGRYSDFTAGRYLRNWYLETQLVRAQTWGSEAIRRSLHVRARATFLNFWQFTANTDRWFRYKWPWELHGGPALTLPGYTQTRWILRSDSRKSWGVSFRATTNFDDHAGDRTLTLDPLVDFRPTSRATVSLGPVATWSRNSDQYVARASQSDTSLYIVGHLQQSTVAMQARLSYGFSPRLNLDLYAQPFVSTGVYSAFRNVADAGAADFTRRLPLIPPTTLTLDPATNRYDAADFSFANPAFDVREFRLNAVLRWEYEPGSTLYVVWTQARENPELSGALQLGRDVQRLFSSPATNVFMVKLNRWIGF